MSARYAHIAAQYRYGLFRHLGNVLPLWPDHLTGCDGGYADFDGRRVRELRDAEPSRPDVLARVIDFIRDELRTCAVVLTGRRGCPMSIYPYVTVGLCVAKLPDGRREAVEP